MKPLTVIIPTIAGREDILQQVLRGLEQQTLGPEAFDLIIVQDGGGGAPNPSSPLHRHTRTFCHDQRRGAAAARNTAIDQAHTPFGLFLDDDIVPSPKVLETHLAFHTRHQNPLEMAAGRVSWQGHPGHNGLMTWLETKGDWSLFFRLTPGQCFPYWISGFTSFHTDLLRRLRFNESFSRYGCEDHELGYRYFREGGRLRFLDQAEGLHLKPVTAGSTYRDGRHGAWSKWVLFPSYPDATGTPTSLITAIQMERQGEDPEPLIRMLDRFSGSAQNRMNVSTDLLVRFLTGLATCHGMLDYWRETYPGFDQASEHLYQGFVTGAEDRAGASEAALAACPAMPWIQLYAARHTPDPEARKARMRGILAAHPSYAMVFLEYLELLTDPAELEREAERFFATQACRLERSTEQACAFKTGVILRRHGLTGPATALLETAARFECWEEDQLVCARRALRELGGIHRDRGEPALARDCADRQYQMPVQAVQEVMARLASCGPTETLLAGHTDKWLELMGEPMDGARR